MWNYHGLDEPSMRKIFEFDGHRWVMWKNKLPAPVQNSTVIPIDGHELCEKSSPQFMTEEQFVEKSLLKLDTTLPIWRVSRCGGYEEELGYHEPLRYNWWDYKELPFNEKMKCISNRFEHLRTFYDAKKFCKEV